MAARWSTRLGRLATLLALSPCLAGCPDDGTGTPPPAATGGVTACLAQCEQQLSTCNTSCPDGSCRVDCNNAADQCRTSCYAQANQVATAGVGAAGVLGNTAGAGVGAAGIGVGTGSALCYSQCSDALSQCMITCNDASCQSACYSAFNHCNTQCTM